MQKKRKLFLSFLVAVFAMVVCISQSLAGEEIEISDSIQLVKPQITEIPIDSSQYPEPPENLTPPPDTAIAQQDTITSEISQTAAAPAADTTLDSVIQNSDEDTSAKIDSGGFTDSPPPAPAEIKKDTVPKKELPSGEIKVPERKKIFRESRINTIDEMKGRYKSPKKAMFMSLALPGLGQAYVGHYVRGAAYFLIEVGLGVGWRHYVIVKYDEQVKKYRRYADTYWSHRAYEQEINSGAFPFYPDPESRTQPFRMRDAFCDAVYPKNISRALNTCKEFTGADSAELPYLSAPHHDIYSKEIFNPADPDTNGYYRSLRYNNLNAFYELIGKYDEFIMGWDDVKNIKYDSVITGTSDHRQVYRDMRLTASEYSRMQSKFLGGIVVNHLISAVDAAIAAKLHNKKLYQTEVKWYDRIHLEGFLAFGDNDLIQNVIFYLPF